MAPSDQQTKEPGRVTVLLKRWRAGSDAALQELVSLVYDDLRSLARAHMRGERPGHTLEPTALVHQAYQRLLRVELDWRDRAHFLNMASRTMRRVLVEHARARRREKRGGNLARVTLGDQNLGADLAPPSADLLELDMALDSLASFDEKKSHLVQGHYFAGMTYRELAEAFGISEATVHRELRLAKAWLARALGGDE